MIEVYRSLEAVPSGFGPSAVTIGNFDGVHVGHQAILTRCVARAGEGGLTPTAILFDPHPLRLIAPERAPALMTTPAERIERFSAMGIRAALLLPFTDALRVLTPEEFARRVLVEKLGARNVVVGGNFRFGARHAGDIGTLVELGRRLGFQAEAVSEIRLNGRVVSSSAIRSAVAEGRLGDARRLLGAPFRLRGQVVSGRGIGSKQTVPTLNLDPESELIPADGVYVTRTRALDDGRCWRSVTNVGVRPTFGQSERVAETHLLDPLEGPSPERIEISFHRRLRAEKKFETPEELRRQILIDAARAQRFFRLLEAVEREQSPVE